MSRLIYLFPKVFSLDEKSLGKIVKCCFFGGVKKKSFDLQRLTFQFVVCVTCIYLFQTVNVNIIRECKLN